MGKKGRNHSAACEEQKDSKAKLNGCPIPLKKGCLVGFPLPTKEDGGLQMTCNNESCPFKGQLVHDRCLEALEETLIKGLEQTGSARGWSDAQRKSNLWGRRGIPLVQRNCRCPCDHGFSVLDMTAIEVEQMHARAQDVAAAPPVQQVPKKKKKNNNLPALNTGKGKDANRKVERRLLERDFFRDDDAPNVPNVPPPPPSNDPPIKKHVEPVVLRTDTAPAVNPWNTAKLPTVEPLDLSASIRGQPDYPELPGKKDHNEFSIHRPSPPLSVQAASETSDDLGSEESPSIPEQANDHAESDEFPLVSLAEFLTLKTSKNGKKRVPAPQVSASEKKWNKLKQVREFEIPEPEDCPPNRKSNNPWFTDDLEQKRKIYDSRPSEESLSNGVTINADITRPVTPSTPSSLQSDLLVECRELSSQVSQCVEYEELRRAMMAPIEPPTVPLSSSSLHLAPPPGFEHVTMLPPPPGFGHLNASLVSDLLPREANGSGLPDFSPEKRMNAKNVLLPSSSTSTSHEDYLSEFMKERILLYGQAGPYDGLFRGPSFFLGEELLATQKMSD
uniref:Verprolin n=1 Tax=Steinernema glaseri TaxID=37863 RepID=A0A1I8ALP1_9BILA